MSANPHHDALPEVHDEAPNSPFWLPALGLGLLVVLALAWVVRHNVGGDDASAQDAQQQDAEPQGGHS